MSDFKDHFSTQAHDYARFRPRYPKALFEFIGGVAPGRELAWDCATGNGQAALDLAAVFDRVIATDASPQQIDNATTDPRVSYRVATAEDCALDPHTIDAVTVAQALHWFDLDRFYAEVRRVLRPNGIIAAWAYCFLQSDSVIEAVVDRYYSQIVGPFWPPERSLVERFAQLPFPFERIPSLELFVRAAWTLDQLLGYLRSWSATQRYLAARNADPLALIMNDLGRAWGESSRTHEIVWPIVLHIGRVPG